MNFFESRPVDTMKALFEFKDVSPKTQTHLKNVY